MIRLIIILTLAAIVAYNSYIVSIETVQTANSTHNKQLEEVNRL